MVGMKRGGQGAPLALAVLAFIQPCKSFFFELKGGPKRRIVWCESRKGRF
jgi:hypothetical protein